MQATATLTAVPAASTFRIRTIIAPLAAVVLGTFMVILDSTVVNVAVPTLQHVFKADLQLIQWVVTAYMLAQAAIIPLAGWLSDRFGIKNVYITALVLFTLGSVLCAVDQSAQMLIVFRVLQGLGGGMLMPLALAYVFRLTPPEKRGATMGTVGIPILLGPAFGPILAGWFLQYADWRYIFLINVPVGIVAVLVALRALPMLSALHATGGIDLPGAILGPLGFAALSYGISQSASMGWGDRNTIAGLSTYLYDRPTTHLATARHAIASYQQALMAQAAAAHPGAVSASAGQATPPHAMVAAMQHYATHATQGALAQAFDDMFLASTVVVGVALLLAFTLRRHPRATQDPADGDIGMEVMVA